MKAYLVKFSAVAGVTSAVLMVLNFSFMPAPLSNYLWVAFFACATTVALGAKIEEIPNYYLSALVGSIWAALYFVSTPFVMKWGVSLNVA